MLLALLLLNANRAVSVDRIVDALWPDEPPANAAKAVQIHVSRLRKELEPHGLKGRLVTRQPGYMLTAEDAELDLAGFERLLAEGEAALAAGDAVEAARLLREALALWRGGALDGVPAAPWLSGALEQQRLTALESRVEADLALGRHAQVVGELESLVAEHPFRERLQGQLLLALYRSGRQADALAAYQRARRPYRARR